MTILTYNVFGQLDRRDDWRDLGVCRRHDEPDLWYATGSSTEGRAQQREAQSICHACPVLQACGQWALNTREQWGVWGGMTEAQRRSVLRRRAAKDRSASARDAA